MVRPPLTDTIDANFGVDRFVRRAERITRGKEYSDPTALP